MDYISVVTKTDGLKEAICETFKNSECNKEKATIKLPKLDKDKTGAKLSEIIGRFFENKLIIKLINRDYGYYTRTEKIAIYKKVIKENSARIKHLRYIIYSNLNEYLKNNDTLIIEGFVNFRLKEYESRLGEIIEESVESYFLEKEYNDFIEMIKMYTNSQKPLVDTINVYKTENSFKLIAEDGADITDEYTADIKNDCRLFVYTEDDILLSALIGMAPKKIFFHNKNEFENKQFIETLQKIFSHKIIFV